MGYMGAILYRYPLNSFSENLKLCKKIKFIFEMCVCV